MRLHIALRTAAVGLTAGCLLAGCGSSSSQSSSATTTTVSSSSSAAAAPPASSTRAQVNIRGYAYQPATLTLAAGTRLTFINKDATAHTATASSPAFDTGSIKPGQQASVTLTKPGTYSYICQFHPFMRATVQVR